MAFILTVYRHLLRKCIAFPGDIPWYQPDLARYCWKLGRSLQAFGRDGEEAARLLAKAMCIRKTIAPEDNREEQELQDVDWDNLIYMLYR